MSPHSSLLLILLFCFGASTVTPQLSPYSSPLPSPSSSSYSSPPLSPSSSAYSPPSPFSYSSPSQSPSPSPSPSSNLTAVEVLESFNLPIGLLPSGAVRYYFDAATGRFSAYLNRDNCSFSMWGYEFRLRSPVTGVIFRNRLHDLQGLDIKRFLFWTDIRAVERLPDDRLMKFSSWFTSIYIPVDSFSVSPTCSTT